MQLDNSILNRNNFKNEFTTFSKPIKRLNEKLSKKMIDELSAEINNIEFGFKDSFQLDFEPEIVEIYNNWLFDNFYTIGVNFEFYHEHIQATIYIVNDNFAIVLHDGREDNNFQYK